MHGIIQNYSVIQSYVWPVYQRCVNVVLQWTAFALMIVLAGCEVMPSAFKALPLLPNIQSEYQLNIRLEPQSSVFFGLELAGEFENIEPNVVQTVIMQELGHYFSHVSYFASKDTQSLDQWFSLLHSQAPFSDYLLVTRIVDLREGNIIRTRHCMNQSDVEQQSQSHQKSQPAISNDVYSELHPFGPIHHVPTQSTVTQSTVTQSTIKSTGKHGVVLSKTAQGFDDVIFGDSEAGDSEAGDSVNMVNLKAKIQEGAQDSTEEEESTETIERASSTVLSVNHVQQQGAHTVEQPLEEQFQDISEQDNEHEQYKKTAIDKAASLATCEVYFANGRDEVKIATWLYSTHQRILIDRSQAYARSGFLGWQLETVHDLLRVNIRQLAKKYTGF